MLYKTEIVIWTEYHPRDGMELEDLAREATRGDGYCSRQETTAVEDPASDPHAPSLEFFNLGLEGEPDAHRRNPGHCAKCGGECYFNDDGERVVATQGEVTADA